MFRKEYPPMLMGRPEQQLEQLRDYLVRLIGYIDEALAADKQETDSSWQQSVDSAIAALRRSARNAPLIQHGSAAETGDVKFPKSFAEAPAVFVTDGTVSNVTATGFFLTTTGASRWIAVGDPRR